MTRQEAIREACRIMAFATHSIGDYTYAADGFCDECQAAKAEHLKSGWEYRNDGKTFEFVRKAILEKLERDGIKPLRSDSWKTEIKKMFNYTERQRTSGGFADKATNISRCEKCHAEILIAGETLCVECAHAEFDKAYEDVYMKELKDREALFWLIRTANSEGQWSKWSMTNVKTVPNDYRQVKELTGAQVCLFANTQREAGDQARTRAEKAEKLVASYDRQDEAAGAEGESVDSATEVIELLRSRADKAEAHLAEACTLLKPLASAMESVIWYFAQYPPDLRESEPVKLTTSLGHCRAVDAFLKEHPTK